MLDVIIIHGYIVEWSLRASHEAPVELFSAADWSGSCLIIVIMMMMMMMIVMIIFSMIITFVPRKTWKMENRARCSKVSAYDNWMALTECSSEEITITAASRK